MTTHLGPAAVHPHSSAAPQPAPVGLAITTQIVAATWMVLAVARAIVGAVAVSSVTGGRVDPEFAFFLVDALAGVLGLVQLLALILGGLWLYLFVVAAREINREAWHERAAYWGPLGWIAPIVNLWFPYQVVRDGAAAVGLRSRMLPWWWAGWISLSVLALVEGVVLSSSPYDLSPWVISMAVLAVLTVVTGVLWIVIVRSMTAAARAATTVRT
ncbi:DUF4328 domain-containing protein [Janibacter anophelis]|uniref:DUF4328 domain-containing protein n=1 Tax=Janibacter anophelis TaxID=319054 RepID=UPI000AED8F87|nr:DUF4328 domain-containing protein [Janibacter anophelis]